MESNADENSPPRSDLVAKTRRQSTLLDSPSRVTRSQVRRLSSAPVEPPMSPKPAVNRRRSARVSESISDVASQDDVSSIQDEAETGKPIQRARRSTRRSFADTTETALSQRSTLSSIEEDTKPVTRRTRASLKPVEETDSELVLPPTRRTRRSSISSVTSVSTIASNAQSPQRRTRASRRNLSPVPSPTFSEASVISELPEGSPNIKKTNSPAASDLNTSSKSIPPLSSNVSPAMPLSGKTPNSAEVKRSSSKDKSPMVKLSDISFTTPRQLNLDDSGSASKKRASLTNEEIEIIDVNEESDNSSIQKSRRSQGRLSLTSRKSTPSKPAQFIESPLQKPSDEIMTVDLDSQSQSVDGKPLRVSVGSQNANTERPRRNSGRLSLSKFVETPLSNSDAHESEKLNESSPEDVDSSTNVSSRKLELDKSLNSSKRLSLSKFVENPLEETGKKGLVESETTSAEINEILSEDNVNSLEDHLNKSKTELEKSRRSSTGNKFIETPFKNSPTKQTEDVDQGKSGRQSISRASLSSVKSPELEKSQRKSANRFSLASNITSDTNPEDDHETQADHSSRKSTGRLSLTSIKSPESQRNSMGRLSLNSQKSLIIDLDRDNDEIQPEKSSRKSSGRDSVSPVKSPELGNSKRLSVGRFSLTSLKNTDPDSADDVQLEKSSRKSIGRDSLSPSKSPELEKSSRKSVGRDSTSPVKSPEVEESQRMSVGRLSLLSNKSVSNIDPDNADNKSDKLSRKSIGRDSVSPVKSPELEKSQRKSIGSEKSSNIINPDTENEDQGEKSSRKSTGSTSASPLKSPELDKSQRSSFGRLSLTSNKSSPIRLDNSPHLTPRDVANLRSYFASSTPTACLKEQSPVKEVSLLEKSKVSNQSLSRSSGRLSLTPSKSVPPTKSNVMSSDRFSDQVDDDGDDDSEDVDSEDVESHESDSNPRSIGTSASTSHRASTGNTLSEQTFESEGLGKSRVSTGSLPHKSPLKSGVLNSEVEESLSISHSNNISKGSSHADNSSSFNDKTKIGMSEDLNVSPIKQDQAKLKNLTLTPSSSENSFNKSHCSPNHAFEKSTVFNEQDVSFGSHTGTNVESEHSLSTSRPSSQMNVSHHIENLTNDTSIKSLERKSPFKKSTEVLAPSDTEDNIDKPSKFKASISSKVYKDAAFLLSGGSVSDFDDQEDDDADKWQQFSSPATKSKREKRLEKKAKKKIEKEERRKAKLERMKQVEANEDDSDGSDVIVGESYLKSVTQTLSPGLKVTTSNSQASDDEVIEVIHSDKTSRKRKVGSTDFNTSKITDQNLEVLGASSELVNSVNKRKSLPDSDNSISNKKMSVSLLQSDVPTSMISTNDNIATLLDDFVDIASEESADCVELVRSDPAETLKKKKKKKLVQVNTNHDIASGEQKIKKTKKNKLKQLATNVENESVESDKPLKKKKKNKDQSNIENESEAQMHEIKKAKKKARAATVEEGSEQPLKKKKKVTEKSEPTDAMKLVKKKKKNDKEQASTEAESEDTVKLVTKKKKKAKLSVMENQVHALEELHEVRGKKTKKNIAVDKNTEDNSGVTKPQKKLKKKSHESFDSSPLDVNDGTSAKILKKKKKNNAALVEPTNGNGSDSDDAPTSVSFAAGKESALAELSAAAESIKKQKELKKQKLKIKQERMREEKLAKLEKLKKKQKRKAKHLESREVNSSTGISVDGSSYKIYFDGENNASTSKLPKRLPEEFLESLSEQPPTKLVRRADGSKERVAAAAVSKEEQEYLERKKAKKLARKMEKQRMLQADYVPLEGVLGSTRFGVVPLRNIMLAKKLEKNKLAEEAANFRQQSLFGNRIRRTPISSVLSHKEKLKASGKDQLVKSK